MGHLFRRWSKAGARYQAGYCRSTGGRARCAPGPGDPSPSPARASSPARLALGGVDSVMSPGLALRQAGSRGSSAGGLRRARLARREAGWIVLRWLALRKPVPARAGPFRADRSHPGADPGPPALVRASRPGPLRSFPGEFLGMVTRPPRGGGAVPGRVRSSGAGGRGPRILTSPEHPGRPTSPMHPIGTGTRGTRSIYRRVGCPNLPQRPRSGRSAGEESLIFRASSHGRSRRGTSLWQIWTRPRPGSSQEPHPHHPAPAHPRQHVDPDPRTAHAAGEARIRRPRNRNTGGGRSGVRAHDRIRGIRPRKKRLAWAATAGPPKAPTGTASPV